MLRENFGSVVLGDCCRKPTKLFFFRWWRLSHNQLTFFLLFTCLFFLFFCFFFLKITALQTLDAPPNRLAKTGFDNCLVARIQTMTQDFTDSNSSFRNRQQPDPVQSVVVFCQHVLGCVYTRYGHGNKHSRCKREFWVRAISVFFSCTLPKYPHHWAQYYRVVGDVIAVVPYQTVHGDMIIVMSWPYTSLSQLYQYRDITAAEITVELFL